MPASSSATAIPAPIVPAPITARCVERTDRSGSARCRPPSPPRAPRRTHDSAPSTPASPSTRGTRYARPRALRRTICPPLRSRPPRGAAPGRSGRRRSELRAGCIAEGCELGLVERDVAGSGGRPRRHLGRGREVHRCGERIAVDDAIDQRGARPASFAGTGSPVTIISIAVRRRSAAAAAGCRRPGQEAELDLRQAELASAPATR